MKILMVCLGNICRSPLAQGILQAKIAAHQLDWEVDSAGTGGWHEGEPPDHRSILIAAQYGIDITDQRARKLQQADLSRFDLILAMDRQNYQDILRIANTPQQRAKVHLIMNFVAPHSNQEVPDPYWDGRFDQVFQMLNNACDALWEHITGET
ncbi:MAG TPA: low molecular weight protein-tyrosine-phosphatase [Saprospiraceae bacterium]|nr:low molecular weight protein-tyrosine-phosphatase [Saprospiraceae bacterium]